MMIINIEIIGWLLILLSLIHGVFPRYFKWPQNLVSISLINRQIIYIHTLFIALMLFMMGLLCITSAQDLIQTPLGKRVLLGLSLFWIVRFVVQFLGYSSLLWKGKKFETTMHILFALAWAYFSTTFVYAYLSNPA